MATLFTGAHGDPLLQFILQLALTLAVTRLVGKVFTYLQQPQVVGEIIAGVLLGPSVLGLIPGFTTTVWPTAIPLGPNSQSYDSTITFGVVADVGVVLFMFMLGCELDHEAIKQQWRKSLPIALSAIAMPFTVGAAASLWLEEVNKEGQPADWQPPRYRSFMLFTGAAMSFTAFPVLASLLTTMGLLHAPIGVRVLSCAAVDDVTAWCVLALASSFAQSASALQGLYTCLAAMAYVAVMLLLLRPALRWLHGQMIKRDLVRSRYYICLVILLLLASAYTTEALGIHCFFGAFMMGLITPKEGGFAETFADKMELVVVEVMLPLFFANSGIKTQIGTMNTIRYWGITLALMCIACFAKFTPACLMSKLLLRDKNWRFCVAVGLLMNTRGLVEVIALNIGLSMGILSPRMFTMMLLMALATTCTTTPLIHLVYRGRRQELQGEALTPAAAAAAKHARKTSVVFLHGWLAQQLRQETLNIAAASDGGERQMQLSPGQCAVTDNANSSASSADVRSSVGPASIVRQGTDTSVKDADQSPV